MALNVELLDKEQRDMSTVNKDQYFYVILYMSKRRRVQSMYYGP